MRRYAFVGPVGVKYNTYAGEYTRDLRHAGEEVDSSESDDVEFIMEKVIPKKGLN